MSELFQVEKYKPSEESLVKYSKEMFDMIVRWKDWVHHLNAQTEHPNEFAECEAEELVCSILGTKPDFKKMRQDRARLRKKYLAQERRYREEHGEPVLDPQQFCLLMERIGRDIELIKKKIKVS